VPSSADNRWFRRKSQPFRPGVGCLHRITTANARMRPSPARRRMRCISVVVIAFPEISLPTMRVPEQLG